jgi:hypothetical protein
MEEVNKIIIIPAIFLRKSEKGYVVRCLIDKDYTEDREFEAYSLEGIKDPKYLLIGIKSGHGVRGRKKEKYGFTQITFVDANDLEKMFIKKWMELYKNVEY